MSRTLLLSIPLLCLSAGPVLAADPTPASPAPASPTPASPTPASPAPASPAPASPAPASPTPANPTLERAASAEDAIRDFMNKLLGPSVRVGDKPVHLQPSGDGYDASATVMPGQQITAHVKEGAAGVWTFEKLHYPNPLHFTVDLPSAVPNGPDTHLSYDVKAADQDGAGAIDTTLATPSTASTDFRAMDVAATGTDQSSASHVDHAGGTTTLRPGSAAGTVDLLSTSSVSNYSITANARTPEVALDIRLDMDGADAKGDLSGIVPDKGMALMRQAVTTVVAGHAARPATAQDGTPLPFDPGPVHELVRLLDGVATSGSLDESATKMRGTVNGFAFSLDRVRMTMDGKSPDGQLTFGMGMEADGLVLPALASTPMGPLIPSKVALHPSITGVNTHDMLAALYAATDPARPADAGPPPEFMALLSSPGLAATVDGLEVDIGPSVLTGTGKVTLPGAGRYAATGRLALTQFDALADRIKALPQAGQALPVLVFAKGIGRVEGDSVVWDISYDGAKLLVNGVDILAMAGGGGGAGGGEARPAPVPAPQNRPQPQQRPNNRR